MARIRAEVEARLIGLIGLINLKFMLIRGSGPPDMKHKVDANQILDAFEKDQDAQQLFRNAEKMIDGEFDVEAAREFWARWKTLSCFQKTRLWLQSSRYEMLCPGLHRPHRSFHCSLLVPFSLRGTSEICPVSATGTDIMNVLLRFFSVAYTAFMRIIFT